MLRRVIATPVITCTMLVGCGGATPQGSARSPTPQATESDSEPPSIVSFEAANAEVRAACDRELTVESVSAFADLENAGVGLASALESADEELVPHPCCSSEPITTPRALGFVDGVGEGAIFLVMPEGATGLRTIWARFRMGGRCPTPDIETTIVGGARGPHIVVVSNVDYGNLCDCPGYDESEGCQGFCLSTGRTAIGLLLLDSSRALRWVVGTEREESIDDCGEGGGQDGDSERIEEWMEGTPLRVEWTESNHLLHLTGCGLDLRMRAPELEGSDGERLTGDLTDARPPKILLTTKPRKARDSSP